MNEDAGRAALVATEICTQPGQARRRRRADRATAERGERRGVELLGLDKGPGIADWPSACATATRPAAAPAPVSARWSGMSQRVRYLFAARPRHGGAGAAVAGRPRTGAAAAWRSARIVVPKPGEAECGDAWCYVERAGGALVLGVDGLGHGLGAAQAAHEACERLHDREDARAGASSSACTQHCARRAAPRPSSLEIDWDRGQLLAAGIGNMVAAIVEGDDGQAHRRPTTASSATRAARSASCSYPITPATLLIMHSDGLTTSWHPSAIPD